MPDEIEGRPAAGAVRIIFAVAAIVATVLAINQLLNLQLLIGVVFIENRYLYLLAATLFPLVFLIIPARKGDRSVDALVRLADRHRRLRFAAVVCRPKPNAF